MLFVCLISLLLLSELAAQVEAVPARSLTYNEIDSTSGSSLVCDQCPPGTYLRSRCTSMQKSQCAPCPQGSFTELWNHITKCLRCGVCGQNQVVKTACTADRDCQCECIQGYYWEEKYDMCVRHTHCQSGQGVLTEGTPYKNTVCQVCSDGTFSNAATGNQNCTAHTSCDAAGLKLLLKGSTWHNSVCASCEHLRSRDGADYLKEIIPAFFQHQRFNIRMLRRIVRKLPSTDGKRHEGISGLSLSALHVNINTWVASATAKQIRQVPHVLTNLGADIGGNRLHSKLQRIDSNLNTLCGMGNEVDMGELH
uniref:TNFR-Cys domain-containing protein n=1 Tax=Monopterus albus TaxID=43700 RepID=A0A3Q3QZ80_MONAL|nr:tumor necrosis factor receptor superfamily member 6B-like [Monopterus albus]